MPRLTHGERRSGSIQDLAKLLSLDDTPGKVLLVSDRTLYLLANLAMDEVRQYPAYASSYGDADLYYAVEYEDTAAADVDTIANNFGLEVIPVSDIRAVISATMYTTWATQEVPNNTIQKVAFQVVDNDTGGIANLGSDLLTAPRDGRYIITGSVQWAVAATGIRRAFIRRNGVTLALDKRQPFGAVADMNIVTIPAWLVAGDQITLEVLQNSGASLDVTSPGSVSYVTSLGMVGF